MTGSALVAATSSVVIEIEAILPGVPIFRVGRYGELADLYLVYDSATGWHSLDRCVGLRAWIDAPQGELPPLSELIEDAFPELLGASSC